MAGPARARWAGAPKRRARRGERRTRRRAAVPLDRWQVRRELGQIIKAAGGGAVDSASCVILIASDVPLEDISQLVGHVSANVTETVYRHEIRPALTKGAVAIDKIFGKAPGSA